MNAHLHAWIEKNIRVQTNLENLEKKGFFEKAQGKPGKLREKN